MAIAMASEDHRARPAPRRRRGDGGRGVSFPRGPSFPKGTSKIRNHFVAEAERSWRKRGLQDNAGKTARRRAWCCEGVSTNSGGGLRVRLEAGVMDVTSQRVLRLQGPLYPSPEKNRLGRKIHCLQPLGQHIAPACVSRAGFQSGIFLS